MSVKHHKGLLFSIVIPTYNRAGLISKAIESVIGQTYPHWELIIVDDCSIDNTSEIISSFEDSRIQYYRLNERKERSYARNYGVIKAKGDYVSFLDSDEFLMGDYLFEFNCFIKNQNIKSALIGCGGYTIEDKSKKKIPNSYTQRIHPIEEYWDNNSLIISGFVIERKILNSIRFPEEFFMWEDKYFILDIMLHFDFYYVNKYLCVYFDHPTRSVNENYGKKFIKNALNRIECLNDFDFKFRDKMLGILCDKVYYKGILQYYYWYSSIAMKNFDFNFSTLILEKMLRYKINKYSLFCASSILFRIPFYWIKARLN